jgi:hypothetical protein
LGSCESGNSITCSEPQRVHDALHNTLPLSPKTSHLNPLRHRTYIRSSVTKPSYLQLIVPFGLFPLWIATKFVCASLVSAIHATYPAHLILLGMFPKNVQSLAVLRLLYVTRFNSPTWLSKLPSQSAGDAFAGITEYYTSTIK